MMRVLALAWLTAMPPASDEVRRAANEAATALSDGRYDEALAVLERAAKDNPDPVFVFMQGVVEQERGNCEAAIGRYEDYLALGIPAIDAQEAQRRLEACRQATQPIEAPQPAPPEPLAPTRADDEQPNPPQRPWHRDPLGWSLTASGLALGGAGVGLFAQARIDRRAARESEDLDTFDDQAQRARHFNTAAIVTTAVASGLVVAGITRLVVLAVKQRRTPPSVALRREPDGATITIRF